MSTYTGKVTVCSVEGTNYSLYLAGPIVRFISWVIDLLCVLVLLNILGMVIGVFSPFFLNLATAIYFIGYFVITIGYSIFFEWLWRGQTVGKKVLNLRVVDTEGLPLSFPQILIRNVLRIVDSLPALYLVGGIVAVSSKRSQRLGDLAANTLVVRIPQIQQPDLEQLKIGTENSLSNYPTAVGRLKQEIESEEAVLIVTALMRRETLEPHSRVRLYGDLRDAIQLKAKFPDEALIGLSAEQYLRNVAGLLYGKPLS